MILDDEACYRALLAHDPRFDGAFFVGVSTTGIYCRTICPAKTPGRDRCTFFPSASAAEKAGYRPCLRCRPELAPGRAPVDSAARLAAMAAAQIEETALVDESVAELAARLGVTDRHLRRIVEQEYGVSPIEMAQTRRLLAAKQLLTDTNLTITEIAFASGFSSLRRFNSLFKERYRLCPSTWRRPRRKDDGVGDVLRFTLGYRPPYDWDRLIGFLGADAVAGVECVTADRYMRTVAIGRHAGWISVSRAVYSSPSGEVGRGGEAGSGEEAGRGGRNALQLEISASLAPDFLKIIGRVKRLFDLSACPETITQHLGPMAEANPGLRVPGAFDGFELAVRTIIGQQVSIRAAAKMVGKIYAAFAEPVETPHESLTHLTPTAAQLAALEVADVTVLGIIPQRAAAIVEMARQVASGRLSLDPGGDLAETDRRLREIPGIGEWTAQYVAMRALSWPDAFPHTDLQLLRAMGHSKGRESLAAAEAWRPWRAYAAMHLWNSLEKP